METLDRSFDSVKLQASILSPKSIDENLYSRQLYVLGKEAMQKLTESKVLIWGMGGLGLEVAKNIILAGVNSVTLHDQRAASLDDLSSHFYLQPEDIGKNRAEISAKELARLNPYVEVKVYNGPIHAELLKDFQVVVITESCKSLNEWSKFCHDMDIKFILCETRGVFGRIFCDFGEEFVVLDPTEGENLPIVIESVVLDKDDEGNRVAFCATPEDLAHHLEDGDLVEFLGTNAAHWQVKVLTSTIFSIEESGENSLREILKGGYARRVAKPRKLHFQKYSDAIKTANILVADWAKNNSDHIHVLFQALDAYMLKWGRLPGNDQQDDLALFIETAADLSQDFNIDVDALKELAVQFMGGLKGNLNPMAAFIGGFVGQEVLKACSQKFLPLNQWFYFDCTECLPKISTHVNLCMAGGRHIGQERLLGESLQKRLSNARIFVVGAGAIGCELVKNFAMMGIATSPKGLITVTDMDHIELSNLTRQFLFRKTDVGRPKSVVAVEAARKMNPMMNIIAHTNAVAPHTEHIYNEDFFTDLDCIVLAVDNAEARVFLDKISTKYGLPLLDSGTNGTKGSTQVIIPGRTKTYTAPIHTSQNREIPLCTLKNFPNTINHTIAWARDLFDSLFRIPAENAMRYLSRGRFWQDGQNLKDNQLVILKELHKFFQEIPSDFVVCIQWARLTCEHHFNEEIQQLLALHPPSSLDTKGNPFWAGTKRCPKPIKFDYALCNDFIYYTARLRAEVFSIDCSFDKDAMRQVAASVQALSLKQDDPIPEEDADADALKEKIIQLEQSLPPPDRFSDLKLNPLKFEKDGDNMHVDFITSASNLRAANYDIPPADNLQTKQIVGRIIPAIATTTSVVAGLVCFELYKLFDDRPYEEKKFKEAFLNLALPFIAFLSPGRPQTSQSTEITQSKVFELQGEISLQELMDWFREAAQSEISSISYGDVVLYNSHFLDNDQYMDMEITKIVESLSTGFVASGRRSLELLICGDKEPEFRVVHILQRH